LKVVVVGRENLLKIFKNFGVETFPASTEEELLNLVAKLSDDPEVGIIIVASSLSEKGRSILRELKLRKPLPLIVEVAKL